MSLLMKALEKAAKDREEGEAGRNPATPAPAAATGAAAPKSDFTLEPLAPPPAATAPPPQPAAIATPPKPAAASPPPRAPTPQPPRRPPGAAPPGPGAPSPRSPAAAAEVLRAGRDDGGGGGISDYVQEHPWHVIGSIAALFLIGYFAYVYIQVANPSILAKQPPPAPPAPATVAQATPPPPVPATVAQATPPTPSPVPESSQPPAAPGGTLGAQQLIPLTSLLPRPEDSGLKEKILALPSPTGGSVAQPPAATAAPAPRPAGPAPARETIKVTAGGAAPSISPQLAAAYAALSAGDLESSQRLYNQALAAEPGNVDVRLGLAAIATQQGNGEQASQHYAKVLELDPRNSLAQAGLIGMLGRADPLAAETRLKELIAREPSAYLYFTLGNLYADINRWPDAQQAYFQAHHLQSDNPDYAYNLAVGLEHVGQPKLALNFYRRAAQLASMKGRANFSIAETQERISKLETVVE